MNSTDLKCAVSAVIAAMYSAAAGIALVLTDAALYAILGSVFAMIAAVCTVLIGRRA